jgi:nucleolar protein 56
MGKYISACILGVFVIEDDKIIDKILFKKKPEKIAEKLRDIEDTEEFKKLNKKYKAEYKESDFLNNNLRKIATDLGINNPELNELISKVSGAKTKTKISEKEKRDKLIIQTVSALNDLDKILNYMSERLREWYGLHYPEYKVKDHEKFAEKVSKLGKREDFKDFTKSMGMDLDKDDIKMLKEYADQLKHMYELKQEIVKYLEKIVPKEVPNLNALLDSILAARLLANAGSLEKLAKMPSSKLQLIGAEKALFKFLKGEQKKVPKYGILFTHPDISTAPKEKQGKIARILSAKLTLAARADFYSKKDISKQLVKEYNEKLKEIK